MDNNTTIEGCTIGSIGDIISGSNISKTTNSNNQKVVNSGTINSYGLSEQDWRNLERFMIQRQSELGAESENYKHCKKLSELAKRQDGKSFKDYLQEMGKAAINAVFLEGVKEGTKKLIVPIIKVILKIV